MSMRLAAVLLAAAAAGCAGTAARARPAPAAGVPPRGLALLVGIDRYAQPAFGSVPALAGAENDVGRARHVLVERFGFADADVLVLTGAEATHAAIVTAFGEHLIQRAGPGTKVVFWFSGHGSRALDAAGVETSKTEDAGDGAYDNTMLAYDSREQDLDGAFDLADDEIHSLLRALVQRTDQVLVVTDCCHSSGAVRGGNGPGVRSAAAGRRPADLGLLAPFWPRDVELLDDDAADPVGRFPYVHVAACAEHQEAGELRIGDATFGTLSWFLADAMEQMPAGTSWRALVERVRALVAGCGTRPDQTVCGAGELDREVFGAGAAEPLRGFRVDRRPDGLCIDAGRVHGLVDGATFEIVGLDDGQLRGIAEATFVGAAWCLARWQDGAEEAVPAGALRAVPRAAAMRLQPLRVHLGAAVDAAVLRDFPYAVAHAVEGADHRLQAEPGGLVLVDAKGRRLRPVPADAAGLREALFREYTFRSLWEAIGRTGSWPIAVAVEPADAGTRALGQARGLPLAAVEPLPGTTTANVRAEPLTATGGGSLVTLRARNDSDRDLRLTVLSVSEDRAVNVVWPRRGESDRVLRAGESLAIPVLVGPAADWREGRPMVDRYLGFATLEPADFTAFTSAAPVWSANRGGTPSVPGFLLALLGGTATRGASAAASEFGLAWCDMLLTPPAGAADRPPAPR